jgi:hypothetical protein
MYTVHCTVQCHMRMLEICPHLFVSFKRLLKQSTSVRMLKKLSVSLRNVGNLSIPLRM